MVAFLDGDDGAWGEMDEREQVVVGRRSGLGHAIGAYVDERALERAVGTVFGHFISGGGEDLGDGAWAAPGYDVFCLASCFIHLLGGRGNVDFYLVANVKRGRGTILIKPCYGRRGRQHPHAANCSLASEQTAPTLATMTRLERLLGFFSAHPNGRKIYRASDMMLARPFGCIVPLPPPS